MKRTLKAIAALMLMVVLFSSFQFKSKEHSYVDLGLPSGTLWATCNMGADALHEAGSYFAWGEVEPKDSFDLENYKFYDGQLIKCCNDLKCGYRGYVDKLSVLEPNDAAYGFYWLNSFSKDMSYNANSITIIMGLSSVGKNS